MDGGGEMMIISLHLGPAATATALASDSCVWIAAGCQLEGTLTDWTPYFPIGEGVRASCTHKKWSPYNVVWESTMETSESQWCEGWVIFNSNLCSSSDFPSTDSLLASIECTRD